MKTISWNKFVTWLSTIIVIVSGIVNINNGVDKIIARLSDVLGYFSKMLTWGNNTLTQCLRSINQFISEFIVYCSLFLLLPIAIVIAFIGIINYCTRKYRINIGTHGIPCTLLTMYHFKVANKNNKLLDSIHKDIYHHYYIIKENIRYQR